MPQTRYFALVLCFLTHYVLCINLCSREGSMEVQKQIEKYISPVLEYYEYSLSNTCPLKIENSKYYLEDKNKIRHDNGEYECGVCHKRFVHEYYLLLHNERRHPDLLSFGSTCLDKYAEVFYGISQGKGKIDCKSTDVQRKLLQCKKVVERCFPPDGAEYEVELYKYVYRKLCSPMQCHYSKDRENEYVPVSMTTIILPFVIIVVLSVIIIVFIYKKLSTPKDDLSIFSKYEWLVCSNLSNDDESLLCSRHNTSIRSNRAES